MYIVSRSCGRITDYLLDPERPAFCFGRAFAFNTETEAQAAADHAAEHYPVSFGTEVFPERHFRYVVISTASLPLNPEGRPSLV